MVDLNVALYLDPQQYPHWMNLDIAWLKSEIRKASLKPRIILVSDRKPAPGQTDLYTLFDGNETNISTQNLYQIDLKLDFTKFQNEAFFIQNKKLSLTLTSEVSRNGQSIINSNKNHDFIVAKKFGTGIPIQNNKKIWRTQKKQIASAVISELHQKLEQLKCITIQAKLEKNKAKYYIQYGIVDGINEQDIFILETPETQKFYFKVTDLRPTQTYLELISEAGNIALKDGHTVRIVEGL
jgi:predicted acetyltransferase